MVKAIAGFSLSLDVSQDALASGGNRGQHRGQPPNAPRLLPPMPLSDIKIRQAKPRQKPYKLADEKGLYIEVAPSGGKWWRLKYRFGGKEKRLSLGIYPDVPLAEARARRDEARTLLANGVDPSAHRKQKKATTAERTSNSFEVVAREWFAKYSVNWAPSHANKIIRRLERDLFPWIGGRPIAEIAAPELLTTLRRIEDRGAIETAHRAKQNAGQVFRYAVVTGRAERDPSQDLQGALTPWKPQHYAAITEPKEIGPLMRAIAAFTGTFPVKCALSLAPMLLVRPGELRQAEWSEVDLDGATWSVPAHKMKGRVPHLVPLASQAVTILRELQPLTGRSRFIFPGVRDHTPASAQRSTAMIVRLHKTAISSGSLCLLRRCIPIRYSHSGYIGVQSGRSLPSWRRSVTPESVFSRKRTGCCVTGPGSRSYPQTCSLTPIARSSVVNSSAPPSITKQFLHATSPPRCGLSGLLNGATFPLRSRRFSPIIPLIIQPLRDGFPSPLFLLARHGAPSWAN